MDEETVVTMEEPMPRDDHDRTWHIHEDESWGWGINCADCRGERRGADGASTLPHFNIRHLQRQNQLHTTTQGEVREALGDRWDDPTVGRA